MQLHGFGIIESSFCSFCAQCPETTLHLFCFCRFVDQYWNDVISWICCYFKRNIDICNFNKIFGIEYFENQNNTDLLICFLLKARFLIYRHKIEKTRPNIISFINSIRLAKQSEYIIAKQHGKLKQHFEKWKCM